MTLMLSGIRRSLIVIMMMAAVAVPAAGEETPTASPQTVLEWLQQEHRFLRRYLAVVQQAAHDYSYGYQTPKLLMPIAIDLFTGYVAVIHEAEEAILYPALRQHMNDEQQRGLWLVENDQREESDTVKAWQREMAQYEAGRKKITEVADTIDYLARMVNRHLVLQEERVVPYLELLSSKEQAAVLKGIQRLERERVGSTGRLRYEQLLTSIEQDIKRVAGRIW